MRRILRFLVIDVAMMNICDTNKCKGCFLCQNICPQNCIKLIRDENGFYKPIIDESSCINCGLCKNNCIINSGINVENDFLSVLYKCKSKNNTLVNGSSSGGVFSEIALSFFGKHENSVVYGAAFSDSFNVEHVRITNEKDLFLLRKSKYTQSDNSNIFASIKNDLKNGLYVLYAGTPCQAYALKKYLNKYYERLIIVDVMCFGVTSSKIIRDYVQYKTGVTDVEICYRSKEIPNSHSSFTVKHDGKTIYSENFHNTVTGIGYSFGNGIINKDSCELCEFQNENRVGDITLGDFVYCDKENDFNTSLMIVNSKNGENFVESLNLEISTLSDDEYSLSKERLNRKNIYSYKHKKFFKKYKKYGISNKTIGYFKKTKLYYLDIIYRKIKRKIINGK